MFEPFETAFTADAVAGNRRVRVVSSDDVIGRIGEDELGAIFTQQPLVSRRIKRAATEEAMLIEDPEIVEFD